MGAQTQDEDRVSLTEDAKERAKWKLSNPLYAVGSSTAGLCGKPERQDCIFFQHALVASYTSRFLCYDDGETYVIVPRAKLRSLSVESPGAGWLPKLGFALVMIGVLCLSCSLNKSLVDSVFGPNSLIRQPALTTISVILLMAGLYMMIRPCCNKGYILRVYYEDDKKNVIPQDKKYIVVQTDEEPDRGFLLSYLGLVSGHALAADLDQLENGSCVEQQQRRTGRGLTSTASSASWVPSTVPRLPSAIAAPPPLPSAREMGPDGETVGRSKRGGLVSDQV